MNEYMARRHISVIYFVFLTSPSPIYLKKGAFRQNKTKLGLPPRLRQFGTKKDQRLSITPKYHGQ
jgi:hypothetical protein